MKKSIQAVSPAACGGSQNYRSQATGLTRLRIISLCIVAMLLSGCYAKREVTLPDTFPVSGTVTATNGQIPGGYQIQFTPSDPEKAAFSPLGPDGSFELSTRYMGVECEGVAPGIYRVSLIPPLALCNQGVQPATLPQTIEITAEVTDLKIPFPGR